MNNDYSSHMQMLENECERLQKAVYFSTHIIDDLLSHIDGHEHPDGYEALEAMASTFIDLHPEPEVKYRNGLVNYDFDDDDGEQLDY